MHGVLNTIRTSLAWCESNLDAVQSGLSSVRTNRRQSTKFQKIPSLILHQRNILDNNRFLKNCHPDLVTMPLPSAIFISKDLWVSPVGSHLSLSAKTVLSPLYIPLCLLFLVWLIYDLSPSWAARASLKLTPVALAECDFNGKAISECTGWPETYSLTPAQSAVRFLSKRRHTVRRESFIYTM